jgi:hypothetical protein
MFCVSIAFIYNHKPLIGVIYAPFTNQFFSSCAGRGAFLNETQRLPLIRNPVPAMPEKAPQGCVFSCEWGKDRRDTPDGNMHRKIESFVNMAAEVGGREGRGGMVHGVRSLGSATLDLAYVAMGAFDIWWEGGCWEWDVAAGIAILQEAGGLVTTANPPEDWADAPIEEVRLGSRLYLAIRWVTCFGCVLSKHANRESQTCRTISEGDWAPKSGENSAGGMATSTELGLFAAWVIVEMSKQAHIICYLQLRLIQLPRNSLLYLHHR